MRTNRKFMEEAARLATESVEKGLGRPVASQNLIRTHGGREQAGSARLVSG
jgi:hypothetical protein